MRRNSQTWNRRIPWRMLTLAVGAVLGTAGLGGMALLARPPERPAPLWATAIAERDQDRTDPVLASLYESVDGGRHWTRRLNVFTALYPPAMLSDTLGWASGQTEGGTLYFAKTVNGGGHWTRYLASKEITGIGFLNARDGWRSMTNFPTSGQVVWTVYATVDGGKHWRRLLQSHLAANAVTSAPFFLTSKLGFILEIVGGAWYVLGTQNGGRTFHRLTQHALGGAGVSPIGVTFTTPKRGWSVVASTGAGAGGLNFLMTSTNGGQTWSERTGLPKLASVEQVDFVSAQDGYVLAPVRLRSERVSLIPTGTLLYHTTNGGQSWTLTAKMAKTTLTDLVFVSPGHGFASDGSMIVQTEDGGLRWQPIYRNRRLIFQSLWSLNQVSRLSQ